MAGRGQGDVLDRLEFLHIYVQDISRLRGDEMYLYIESWKINFPEHSPRHTAFLQKREDL